MSYIDMSYIDRSYLYKGLVKGRKAEKKTHTMDTTHTAGRPGSSEVTS